MFLPCRWPFQNFKMARMVHLGTLHFNCLDHFAVSLGVPACLQTPNKHAELRVNTKRRVRGEAKSRRVQHASHKESRTEVAKLGDTKAKHGSVLIAKACKVRFRWGTQW